MSRVAVEGVAKSYGEVRVLDSIDLEVDEAEVVVLLGPSGCGKTTLLRLVAGLDTVDRGVITIADRIVSADGIHVLPEQRQIGLVFQDGALFPHLSVGENVGFGLPRPQRRSSRRIDELLELVGLTGRGGDRPDELSGGQRQRVNIARALCNLPKVLVADEIVSGLDVSIQAQLLNLLARLRSELGFAMLFISHDLSVVRHLCDRVLVMYRGEIVEQGPIETVFAYPQHPHTRALISSVPPDEPGVIWAKLQGN